MNYADNFKVYRNGKLISCTKEQFNDVSEEELKWLHDPIEVQFQVHRADGSWGDEWGIIPSNLNPGRLPPYVIFCKPNGSIGQGDQLISEKAGIFLVKEAVYRYLCEGSEKTPAIFAYL